ncbi:hypothetical protein VPH35_059612 [Triticum aestivum]
MIYLVAGLIRSITITFGVLSRWTNLKILASLHHRVIQSRSKGKDYRENKGNSSPGGNANQYIFVLPFLEALGMHSITVHQQVQLRQWFTNNVGRCTTSATSTN